MVSSLDQMNGPLDPGMLYYLPQKHCLQLPAKERNQKPGIFMF